MIDSVTTLKLLDLAKDASTRAYAPYSLFPVGAALITAEGEIFQGANVENASIGLTICAERSAIVTAVSAGYRSVVAIAVFTPRIARVTPCGSCRQVLNEFKPDDDDMIVILGGSSGPEQVPLGVLLPQGFGPRDLD